MGTKNKTSREENSLPYERIDMGNKISTKVSGRSRRNTTVSETSSPVADKESGRGRRKSDAQKKPKPDNKVTTTPKTPEPSSQEKKDKPKKEDKKPEEKPALDLEKKRRFTTRQ